MYCKLEWKRPSPRNWTLKHTKSKRNFQEYLAFSLFIPSKGRFRLTQSNLIHNMDWELIATKQPCPISPLLENQQIDCVKQEGASQEIQKAYLLRCLSPSTLSHLYGAIFENSYMGRVWNSPIAVPGAKFKIFKCRPTFRKLKF